jgi:hypothetical protein
LYVVVGQGAVLLHLLTGKEEVLLIWWNTCTVEKSRLHNGDGIRTVNLKSHNVANQCLDADMDTEVKSSYWRWYPEAYYMAARARGRGSARLGKTKVINASLTPFTIQLHSYFLFLLFLRCYFPV